MAKSREKKVQKTYVDHGCGFPVTIFNAPMQKLRGEWLLDLDYEVYEKAVLLLLAYKKSRLTGDEVRFIRNYFSYDLKSFAKRFGDVAHSAVIKWEKKAEDFTKMSWSTEKDIRLSIIKELKPRSIGVLYSELEEPPTSKKAVLKVDFKDLRKAA